MSGGKRRYEIANRSGSSSYDIAGRRVVNRFYMADGSVDSTNQMANRINTRSRYTEIDRSGTSR